MFQWLYDKLNTIYTPFNLITASSVHFLCEIQILFVCSSLFVSLKKIIFESRSLSLIDKLSWNWVNTMLSVFTFNRYKTDIYYSINKVQENIQPTINCDILSLALQSIQFHIKMRSSILFIILFLLPVNYSLSNSQLFFLSDAALFQMGIEQFRNGPFHNQLGGCVISDDPHACSHYASVCYANGTCLGLPDLIGTGCLDGCWGPPNTYYNYQSSKTPICTGNLQTDGANMLRIGLVKGYCGTYNSSSASNTTTNNTTNTTTPTNPSITPSVKTEVKTSQGLPVWIFWGGWGLAFVCSLVIVILAVLFIKEKNLSHKYRTAEIITIYDSSKKMDASIGESST